MRNSPVAERDEMLNRFFDSPGIIHQDIAHVLASGSDIMKDHGNLLASELINQLQIEFRSHQGNPSHFQLDQAPHIIRGALSVVVRIDQNYAVAMFKGRVFYTLYQLRKKWIGDVRDQEADYVAAARSKRARMRVRIIVTLLDSA